MSLRLPRRPVHLTIRACNGSSSSGSPTRTPRSGRLWRCPATGPPCTTRFAHAAAAAAAAAAHAHLAQGACGSVQRQPKERGGGAEVGAGAQGGHVGAQRGVKPQDGLHVHAWRGGGGWVVGRGCALLRAHAHTPAPSTPNSCPALNLRCSNTEVGLKSAACAPLRHGRVHGGGRIIRRADGWQARAPQAPLFCTHACTNSRALANQCDG